MSENKEKSVRVLLKNSPLRIPKCVHRWVGMTGDDQAELMEGSVCCSLGCDKPAKLRCPTCIELRLRDSFFCTQECFKNNFGYHKQLHLACTGNPEKFQPWPTYKFTGTLRPAPLGQRRVIPDRIVKPDYALRTDGYAEGERAGGRNGDDVKILNDEEIEAMRVAGKLAREVLDEAARACEPGVTTDQIDNVVHEACIYRDCYPSPLGYHRFPKSVCTSVNEVICHGIPDMRKLENGDICNVDVTVYHRGFHGDVNETFLVGDKVKPETRRLVKVAYECLQNAIKMEPGVFYRDIGGVIQKHANTNGYSVVKAYCGHGIHRYFHTAPIVPHYTKNRATGVMKVGHAFTIEPMINAGTYKHECWPDNWTAVTTDGKCSAQFEHTLLVTKHGCEVLTARDSGRPWFMDQLEELYGEQPATEEQKK